MKKLTAIILILSLLIFLVACGNEKSETDNIQSPTKHTTTEEDYYDESVEAEQTNTRNQDGSSQNYNTSNTPNDSKASNSKVATSGKSATSNKSGTSTQSVHKHSFSTAKCTQPAKCSCGITNGNALGHNWNDATCTTAKKCYRCGATGGNALGHNYVNNKCSRCGKTNPSSLPTELGSLVVIDTKDCTQRGGTLIDSFGNTYNESIQFNVWDDIYSTGYFNDGYAYALYNLDNKYKKFNATVAVPKQAASNTNFKICIYLNDSSKPIYVKQDFNKTTAPFDISIDVSNISKMRIEVYMEGTGYEVDAIIICQQYDMLALVDAKVSK